MFMLCVAKLSYFSDDSMVGYIFKVRIALCYVIEYCSTIGKLDCCSD